MSPDCLVPVNNPVLRPSRRPLFGHRVLELSLLAAAFLGVACFGTACWDSKKPRIADKPVPSPTPATARTADPAPSPGGRTDAPRVVDNPNRSLNDSVNSRIRQDVIDRIDMMPNLSTGQRNKLYTSVERAREMGCVLVVPFADGRRSLAEPERAILVNAIRSPAIQKLTDDPSLVLVVLGYANEGTDKSVLEKLSIDRAENVLTTIRDQAFVPNTMYAIGMGDATTGGKKDGNGTRVAEIWAVFP